MPRNTALADETWQRYAYIRDNGHLDYVKKAVRCEQFFAGLQWDANDLALLRAVRRPALTINKIISTMSNVMGEQIYNRTQVVFRPRNDEASEQLASTLTKVFMQVSDNNQLEWARSDIFADGIITSRGYYDTRLDFTDNLRGEVKVTQLNPKNVLIDPDAEEYDPDSWNDVFITKWMSPDDIALLYNAEDAKSLAAMTESYFPYGYDSIDRDRDRFGGPRIMNYGMGMTPYTGGARYVRVLERQYKVLTTQEHFADLRLGDIRPVPTSWKRDEISAYLEQNQDTTVIKRRVKRIKWCVTADCFVLHEDWSPYKHFTVVPYFPYFRRGTTVGLVENLLGPQELLNKVSSQELHVVNTTANSGWKVKTGALTNMSTAELEARGAQTGLVLELDDIANAEKITPNATPTGLDRISYKAEEHIKTISGVSDYRTGFAREDVSAKAVKANQATSSANTAKVMDNLIRTDHLLARNILDLVQEYYVEPRIIQITTDRFMNRTEPLAVNQPDENGQITNDLTIGEYAAVVTTQPERDTFEDMQFEHALQLRELNIQIPDKFLIKASKLKDKQEIVDGIEAQERDPAVQESKQLDLQGKRNEVSKLGAEAAAKEADAHKKLNEAGQANDQNAEFVAKMTEIETKYKLKEAELQMEFQFEQKKMQQELQIERMKAEQKMQLEREMHDAQVETQHAQTEAVQAQAAATIHTADTNATATQDKTAAGVQSTQDKTAASVAATKVKATATAKPGSPKK